MWNQTPLGLAGETIYDFNVGTLSYWNGKFIPEIIIKTFFMNDEHMTFSEG